MSFYRWDGDDLLLEVRVQPRASKDEIVGPHGEEALKVRITAPPVDGRANDHLIRFLAEAFEVSRSEVEVVAGETGRSKRLRVRSPGKLPPEARVAPRK